VSLPPYILIIHQVVIVITVMLVSKFDNPWEPKSRTGKNGENQNDIGFGDALKKINKLINDMMGGLGDPDASDEGGGGSHRRSRLIIGGVCILLFTWLLSGVYVIDVYEEGVITRFGRYVRNADRGLNYKFPYPIETVYKVNVTRINKETIGFKGDRGVSLVGHDRLTEASHSNLRMFSHPNRSVDDLKKGLGDDDGQMLTGDENMIDLQFFAQWYVADPRGYLFNIKDNIYGSTVRSVAETSMRQVIGEVRLYDALSEKREEIEVRVKQLMQEKLDSYGSGIQVNGVGILYSYVASEVMDAYRDVQSAKADKEREINQAHSYSNSIIPKARGDAQAIMEEAFAYKESEILRAKGEAERYNAILREYRKNNSIVKTRIYIDTLESVLSSTEKVVVDIGLLGEGGGGGTGRTNFLPVLGLADVLQRNRK